MAVRTGSIICSVLLLSLCLGCNSSDLIEPASQPNMEPGRSSLVGVDAGELAAGTSSGSHLKAPSNSNATAIAEDWI